MYLWTLTISVTIVLTSSVKAVEGFFDNVRPLAPGCTDINSSSLDEGPSISEDGLELYFNSDRPGGPGADYDLYVARRSSVDDEFCAAETLPGLNSPQADRGPSISTDALELFFASNRTGDYDIYVARRDSVGDKDGVAVPFGTPVNLGPPVNTGNWDNSPCISADGRELYFESTRNSAWRDVYVAVRADPGEPFSDVRRLVVNTGFDEGSPAISGDGLTLFFNEITQFRPGGHGLADLWVSTRTDRNGEWGPPTNLGPPINTWAWDGQFTLSSEWPHNGAKIYFTRETSPGQANIHVATWHTAPEPSTFLRGDCNADGTVNISDATCILNWLFAAEADPDCVAATNANGDDTGNITDATYLLNHLFAGGPAPVAPYPDCGTGELPEELGCENPSCQ